MEFELWYCIPPLHDHVNINLWFLLVSLFFTLKALNHIEFNFTLDMTLGFFSHLYDLSTIVQVTFDFLFELKCHLYGVILCD